MDSGCRTQPFRSPCGHRIQDVESLREKLQALAETGERPEPRTATKVAFAYTGQGSEWIGMGKDLYESEPVVRAILDRCDKALREERDTSLLDAIFGQTGDLSDLTQPAIYAMESALTALWSSVGIQPSVVVGRDIGEIAAAQVAGVFSLKDGLRIAAARDTDNLEATLADVTIASPSLTLVSSVTGEIESLDATYWHRQAQAPVAFDKCAKKLADLGIDVLIEIGPNAVPGPIDSDAEPPVVLSSLGDDEFVEAVAKAYEAGLPVSFPGLFAGETRRRISLPSYPFQRQHYWIQ